AQSGRGAAAAQAGRGLPGFQTPACPHGVRQRGLCPARNRDARAGNTAPRVARARPGRAGGPGGGDAGRTVRRRAATGQHRTRHRERSTAAAGRRADGEPRPTLVVGDHPAAVADQRARDNGHRHHAQQDDRRCSSPARDSAGRRPSGAGPDARPLRGGGLMPRGAGRARLLAEQTVYFIAEALASFRRNGLMTVAAVTTIVVALLVVGGAVVLGLNLSHLAETLESEVAVVAFLHDGLTSAEITRAQRAVAALPGVASVRFVSRGEALLRLRHRLGDAGAFDDLETSNPLPDSLEIRLGDPLRTKALAGTAAAAMATALLTGLYTLSAAAVRSALPFLPLVPTADALRVAAAGLCAAGILVGATGSVIAVRRFATP